MYVWKIKKIQRSLTESRNIHKNESSSQSNNEINRKFIFTKTKLDRNDYHFETKLPTQIYPFNRAADSLPLLLLIDFTDYIFPKFFSNVSQKKYRFKLILFLLILIVLSL